MEKDGAGNDELSARFATGQGIALEKWSVGNVNVGKGACPALLPGRVAVAEWLSDEQKEAVRFVGSSQDQVMAIRGVAGAGKTTLLKELDGHLAEAKQKLLYLAPTASAVKVQQSEGFTKATTVSEYLAKTQNRALPPEWKGAVVVVDEAGLASNQHGAALLGLAEKERRRIVFVGDSRQHTSVEAGDFLRVLESHSRLGTRELKDIRRQTATDYNQAVRLLASGQAAAGMERLDGMGWIKEGQADYLRAAASEYLRLSAAAKPEENVLCVAVGSYPSARRDRGCAGSRPCGAGTPGSPEKVPPWDSFLRAIPAWSARPVLPRARVVLNRCLVRPFSPSKRRNFTVCKLPWGVRVWEDNYR